MAGDRQTLNVDGAIAVLEVAHDAYQRAQQHARELEAIRYAATVQARRAGASMGRIAGVLGVARQTLSEAMERRNDA